MLSPRRAIKLRKSRISKKRHFSTCRPPSRTVFGPFSIVFGSFSGRFRTVSGRFAQFSLRFFPFFRIVAPRRGRRGVTAPPLRRRSAAARDFQRRSAASEFAIYPFSQSSGRRRYAKGRIVRLCLSCHRTLHALHLSMTRTKWASHLPAPSAAKFL